RPPRAGDCRRARRAPEGRDLRRRTELGCALGGAHTARRGHRASAAPPLRRPRSVDRGRGHLACEIISGTIHTAGRALAAPLIDVRFFDRYQGKSVPGGKVSLSVRLTFQAPDHTLTDADVQESFDRIVAALAGAHGAVQR